MISMRSFIFINVRSLILFKVANARSKILKLDSPKTSSSNIFK